MHVRAMFRVLNVSRNHQKQPLVKLGATYSSRDGVQCEENKRFSKWTPSGECELTIEPNEVLTEGAFVYVDIYPAADAPEPGPGVTRVAMQLTRYEVAADGGPCFYARAYAHEGVRGQFSMQVTNFHPEVVALFRLEAGEGTRPLVLDFSAA